MKDSFTIFCLFLFGLLSNWGCVNPEVGDVDIPVKIDCEPLADKARSPQREWAEEFTIRIESNIKARLELLSGEHSVEVGGVTVAFEEGTPLCRSLFVAVISDSQSLQVVSTVKAEILQEIKNEGISRAEIGFKNDRNSPVSTSCVIINTEIE